jgi:anaerobic magnesium-protoporphyrin IX monomethyl ester cyclase
MKALLINPHKLIPKSLSVTQRSSPPLGLAYIAGSLSKVGFEVEVIDCIAEAPDNYFNYKTSDQILVQGITFSDLEMHLSTNYDMIGVSCMFTNNWLINRDLIDFLKIKFPDALIVAGGEHVSAIPEYCLETTEGLDLVVCGEGEETISTIAEALLNKQSVAEIEGTVVKLRTKEEIVNNGRRTRVRKIETISSPLWEVFPLQKYFENDLSFGVANGRSLPILATRGCPYECAFCSSAQMWTTKYTMRTVEDVIKEIKSLHNMHGVTNFDFYDLTAIINRRWILDFCKHLKQENLKITWQIPGGTRSEAIDGEVSLALFESGCVNITYAPESGSERMLAYIKKKVNLQRMLSSIRQSHQAGLNVKLNIILGYPEERISDILKTIGFLIKAAFNGAHDASPSIFSPYPGFEFFRELLNEGKIVLNDHYFERIVASESLNHFTNYNRHISKPLLVILQYTSYFTFYGFNFLFRPSRFINFILNILSKNYKTRGEYMVAFMLQRFIKFNFMTPKKRVRVNESTIS